MVSTIGGRGDRAADFVQTLIDTGKMLGENILVRLDATAQLLDEARHGDELVFQRADGRAVIGIAKVALDVVKPIGERDDLFLQRSLVETA